jgi:uncharacterized protein involved in exopolysaccharide biosynthesis
MALVASAWKRKWWLVGCVLVFGGIFGVYAKSLPLIYRATVVLVPATPLSGGGGGVSSLGGLGGIASLAGIDINSGASKTDEVLAVLESRQFIERFLKEQHLLPILYAGDWDAQTGAWSVNAEPHTLAAAYKYFNSEILTVEREKTGGLIKLHVDWIDRELAALWANQLVDLLNAEMKARATDEAQRSFRFLEEESKRTSIVPTQQAIGRLMESQMNQRMMANVTSEYALRVVDRAMAPDRNDSFKPRKILLLGVGVAVGVSIGLFIVWFFADPPAAQPRRKVNVEP